jgi:cell division transport system ATP-binding protein
MISFDRVSKRYSEGHDALREVSVNIGRDELVFITGHSGAGKTTLLRIPRHRRNIGVVFQNHRLLLDRTVFDNVALPLIIAGYDHREVGRRVRAALDKVGLLDRERAMPVTLSGGEQQRVGIARAVVGRPKILLADEPTGNLDPALSAEIMQLFEEFNQVGVTVLIASHDLALISRLHHRIITLRHGRLVAGSSA